MDFLVRRNILNYFVKIVCEFKDGEAAKVFFLVPGVRTRPPL